MKATQPTCQPPPFTVAFSMRSSSRKSSAVNRSNSLLTSSTRQQGFSASAYLNDARKVGVTNNQVQLVCPKGSPGAGFFTHESMLSHPLTFALIEDALKHNGVGRPNRLNLAQVCSHSLTPGLSVADFLATEATIPLAALQILLFSPKTLTEPPIRAYAK